MASTGRTSRAATPATSTPTTPGGASRSSWPRLGNPNGQIAIRSPGDRGLRSWSATPGRQAHDRDPGGRRGRDPDPDRRDLGRHPLRRRDRRPARLRLRRHAVGLPVHQRPLRGLRLGLRLPGSPARSTSTWTARSSAMRSTGSPVRTFRRTTSASTRRSSACPTSSTPRALSDSAHDLVIYVVDRAATGARSGAGSSWSTTTYRPTTRNQRGAPRETFAPPQGGAFFSVASARAPGLRLTAHRLAARLWARPRA